MYNRQNELRSILKPFVVFSSPANLKTKCAEKLSRARHKRHSIGFQIPFEWRFTLYIKVELNALIAVQ